MENGNRNECEMRNCLEWNRTVWVEASVSASERLPVVQPPVTLTPENLPKKSHNFRVG